MSDANILLVPHCSGVYAVSQVLLDLSCSNSVLPTDLQWQTAQAWGRTITLGLQLFLQHRLAVPDPQLICSLQGLFTGVVEYLWKIRVVVNRTSRGALLACTHWLTVAESLQFVRACCLVCRDWALWEWCEKEMDARDRNLVPCVASVLGVGWLLFLNLMSISSQILNRYYLVCKY